ncbi:MAG: hypothetical protein ACRD0L_02210 [Acidimicrobiales bacterium]
MGDLPEHLRWSDGARRGGPAVVVDLDGVLSDASGRQRLLAGAAPDWAAFFAAAGDDPVLAGGAALLAALDPSLAVVVSTGRPVRLAAATVAWLARHELRWDLLAMRPAGNRGHAVGTKSAALHIILELGFEPLLALDDDPSVVAMYRDAGVACVEVGSGYYGRAPGPGALRWRGHGQPGTGSPGTGSPGTGDILSRGS